MIRYPKIRSIKHVAQYVGSYTNFGPKVEYKGTVKLHGTNAGVKFHGGKVIPQSRNRQLSLEKDNCGFAAFVHANEEVIRKLEKAIREHYQVPSDSALAIFGEWIGPGIQSGVAVNQLPNKQWVLFGLTVQDGEHRLHLDLNSLYWFYPPSFSKEISKSNIYSVFDVPNWELTIDFSSPSSIENAQQLIESMTQEVEDLCPWGNRFGIKGLGEGIVWQPQGKHFGNSDLVFKSKGKKHKVVADKSKKKDLTTMPAVADFVSRTVTENRLNQGVDFLREMDLSFSIENISHFLKWIGKDVKSECQIELQESNLKWKDVSKLVTKTAANWYKEKL